MKFRIRSKVAAALIVPLLALVVGSGLLATQSRADADEVDAEIDMALAALGPGSLTSALQDERNFLSLDLIGLGDVDAVAVSSFDEATAATDAAAAQLRARLAGFEDGGDDGGSAGSVREAYAPALESLAGLEEARDRYQASTASRDFGNIETADAVFGTYQKVIGRFFAATATVAADLDHASLRNGVELFDALNRRGEALSVAIRHLAMDMLSGAPSTETTVAVAGALSEVRVMQQRIDELSVGAYQDVATDTGTRDAVDEAVAAIEGHLAGGDVDLAELLDIQGLGDDALGAAVTGVLLDEAADVRSAAQDRMRLLVIVATVVICLAILVTYFTTTSITRPLRALRREADELARTRLPGAVRSILDTPPGEDVSVPELAPIDVESRDEVGEVVGALNDVQSSTLTLAADQAVLRRNFADSFVNLGRRNQLLLDRQLDFITQLEQNETDPEQLDALFKLDHLATRMRRNAESLLVLAGAESPRQWTAPVAVTDVVRAGLGEVEDYQRVNIRHLDDAHVRGEAVAGLAHVLAELTENAIAFSPPEEPVEVKGRWSGNGDYVIAIADNGIGMTDEELERANRRLSGRESYTVAPSRYLGHFVTGNLARRLGVTVRLQDDPAGGLVATVTLAPSVLHTGAVEEPSLPNAPAAEPDTDVRADAGSDSDAWPDARADDGWTADGWVSDDWPDDDPAPEADPVPDDHPAPHDHPAPDDDALDDPERVEVEETPASVEAEPEQAPELERILYGRLYGDGSPDEELPVDPADPFEPEPQTTGPDGLPRRVPGAQRPDLTPLARRSPSPAASAAGPTPAATPEQPAESRPEGALGFLQAFQSREASTASPNGNGFRHGDESTEEDR